MLDFEPAMRLIVKRADFMKAATEVQPGRIMVVFKNADSVLQLIRDCPHPEHLRRQQKQ